MTVCSGERSATDPVPVVAHSPDDDELALAVIQLTNADSWRSDASPCTLDAPSSADRALKDVLGRLRTALADRYTVDREIGRGGMAYVFLARDRKHHRQVALKVLRPELAASVGAERFLREIQIEASLQHPHVLPLYDSGKADSLLYYTMPFVEGETLREKLRRETQLEFEEALRITREIVDGVAYAHSQGVVHRDIKPENIMLSKGHALVADFGVARALSEAGGEQLTDSGIAVGTPAYMSPEQALASSNVDFRSDVYSLGLVAYEMLAGEPPFTGATPLAVLARHANERVPSLEIVRPNVPSGIVFVIEKALAKVPADRYQTVAAFGEALDEGTTTEVRLSRPRLRPRRWPIPVATASLLVGLIALWWFFFTPDTPINRDWIVVYPLEVSGQVEPADEGLGEDNTYLIWNALDGRGSLKWINALDRVEDPAELSEWSSRRKRAFAQGQGAAFYLDGRTLLEGSNWHTYLQLYNAVNDSVVARADTIGPPAQARLLGVQAVGALLLEFLPEEETVDVSAIAGRDAEAVQAFVQAERRFHAGQFEDAFEGYSEAVGLDSLFALAAVKAAQAAGWLHKYETARDLLSAALNHAETLTPKHLHFTRGLQAFINAKADTAVYHFDQAIALDRMWPEAWMGIGEVYTHLVPRKAPQDSLGRDAFEQVYSMTDAYAPGLYHLIEYAIRDGELREASRLLEEYQAAEPDERIFGIPALMLRCAEAGPESIHWRGLVLKDVNQVYQAARSLGVGARYPRCAKAAWQAMIDYHGSESDAYMFDALVGLQSQLVATGEHDRLVALMDSAIASGSRNAAVAERYYVSYYLAGAAVDAQARAVVDSFRNNLWQVSNARLWSVGLWDTDRNRLDDARAIRDTLNARAAATGDRLASQLATSMSAHVAAAEGDSALAIRLLESLAPTASRARLPRFWESLGHERLLLARLYLSRQEYRRAFDVAAGFDSPGAVNLTYPTFARVGLEIRLQAARMMNDEPAVNDIQERLSLLGH